MSTIWRSSTPNSAKTALARDQRLERLVRPLVIAQFATERRRVLRHPTNPATQLRVNEWETVFADMWITVGREVFDDTYEALTGDRPQRDSRVSQQLVALITELIRNGATAKQIAQFIDDAAAGVVTTTRKRIQTVLRRLDRPSDIREISRALRRLYTTEFAGRRAHRIALDQVLRATATYEHGAAMLAAETTGRDYVKVWRNQGDFKVRPSHTNVDTVALDENFKVGISELRYPRDPAGPAAETYGCRCWVEHQRI